MSRKRLLANTKQIQAILATKPKARDNDVTLTAHLLEASPYNLDLERISAHNMLALMYAGTVPAFESIRRTRQKLQEEFPHLRGEQYEQRQKRSKRVKGEVVARTNATNLATLLAGIQGESHEK
jgi:hypothetical protein